MLKTQTPMSVAEAAGAEPVADDVLLTADPAELAQTNGRRLGARRARVERLKRQVEQGSYVVDPNVVASALLGRLRAVGRLP